MTHTCAVCGSDRAFYGFGPPGLPRDKVAYLRTVIWVCRQHQPAPGLGALEAWEEAQRLRDRGRVSGAPDAPGPPAASCGQPRAC